MCLRVGLLFHGDVLAGEEVAQFAFFEHLAEDVAAADEFALYIKLGDGRPVGKLLDALTINPFPFRA